MINPTLPTRPKRHLTDLTGPVVDERGRVPLVYVPGPAPVPASRADCIAALERLCSPGGAPRWAATGWAAALVGPFQDHLAQGNVRADSSTEGLDRLISRLAPAPAVTAWPEWLHGRDDQLILDFGVSQGKPDKREVVEIPDKAGNLAVEIEHSDGLVRFAAAQWSGDSLSSDGRLLALAELAHWRGEYQERAADVLAMTRWCVGWGRAHRPADAPGRKTAAARMAAQKLSTLDPETVAAHLLAAVAA